MSFFEDPKSAALVLDLPVGLAGEVASWMRDMAAHGKSDETIRKSQRAIASIYCDLLMEHGEKAVKILTAPHAEDLEWLECRWRQSGVRTRTCDTRICAWRSFLKFLTPVSGIANSIQVSRYWERRRFARAQSRKLADPDQQQLAFDFYVHEPSSGKSSRQTTHLEPWIVGRDYAIMLVMRDTGASVNDAVKMPAVVHQLGGKITVWLSGKSGQPGRWVQISDETSKAIEFYQGLCPYRCGANGLPLFVGRHGGPISHRTIYEAVQTAGRASGLMLPLNASAIRQGLGARMMADGQSHFAVMAHLGITCVSAALKVTGWDEEEHALSPSIGRRFVEDEEDDMAERLARRFQAHMFLHSDVRSYSIVNYGGDVEKLVRFLRIRDRAPEEISGELIDAFLADISEAQSKATAARAALSCKWFVRFLEHEGLIAVDSATGSITHIKRDDAPSLVSPAEVDIALRRLDACPDELSASLAAVLVSLAGLEGMSHEEIRSLTRQQALSKFSGTPTGLRVRRLLELSQRVPLDYSIAHLPSHTAGIPSRLSLRRILTAELSRVGLKPMTPRELRGSAIIRWIMTEANLGEVAKRARLANPDRLLPYIKAAERLKTNIANDNVIAPWGRKAS